MGDDRSRWSTIAAGLRHHLGLVTVALVAITVAMVPGLLRLQFSSSQDTMIDPSSTVSQDNLRYQGQFGGEAMVVLLEGNVADLVSPANRAAFASLEADLAAAGGYHSVVSPVTALEYAAAQLDVAPALQVAALQRDQASAAAAATAAAAARGDDPAAQAAAAQQAQEDVLAAFQARIAADGARLATVGEHSLDNPAFVDFLLFDEHGDVRPALQGAFPDREHALMAIRLSGNASIDEQSAAAAKVVELAGAHPFAGFTVTTTGSAALLAEVNDRMRSDISTTGLVAAAVMALILLLLLRARWRLLSLAVVAVAITWAFGAIGYFGIPLTMVTISGLPILIGLGVDFAIQLHSRYEEEASTELGHALDRTASRLGPALGVAVFAAIAGFLVLRLSSVPMIRDFGVLLAVGTAASALAVMTVMPAILLWRDRHDEELPARRRRGDHIVERGVRGMTGLVGRRRAVAATVALLVIVAGFFAQRATSVQSDPERFVPQDSAVLADLRHLRDVAGTSADMGLLIEADDVTRADVLTWMADYEARALAAHPGQLLRSASIGSIASSVSGSTPTPADVAAVLAVTPPALQRTFISDDRKRAQILFSVGHLSLSEQEALLADLRTELHAPAGVSVTPAGLAVVGIATVNALEANQTSMAWAAAAAVFVWLLLALRDLRRAAITLFPVLTALGASAVLVWALGLQVSALGALSSPLVVAICTEFSVLIVERYREERRAGRAARDAMEVASQRIGRAFTASGLTVAGGFAALAISGFPLLTSFGIIVALNIVVSLVVTLVLVPPLLTWGDDGNERTRTTAHEPELVGTAS